MPVLVGVEGIEPSTSVLSGQRSTTELHTRKLLHTMRAKSVPCLPAGRYHVNYTRKYPTTVIKKSIFFNIHSISSSSTTCPHYVSVLLLAPPGKRMAIPHWLNPSISVRLGGIEPPTFSMSMKRSTTELKARNKQCMLNLPLERVFFKQKPREQ